MGFPSDGKLLALCANIRLGWKGMAVANTLAYFDTAIIMTTKSQRRSKKV